MTCRAAIEEDMTEVRESRGIQQETANKERYTGWCEVRGATSKSGASALSRSTKPIKDYTLCAPFIPLPSTSCTLVLRVLLFTSSSASSSTNISTVSPGTSAIVGDFWATLVGGLGTLVLRWCMQFATTMVEVTTTHASGTIRAMYISKVEKSANSAMVVVFELCDRKMSR
jgi:hypothetical protein